MLSEKERDLLYKQAYLPEHLAGYVEALSGEEPFLHEDYLCFCGRNHLTFIGYPLKYRNGDTPGAYKSACKRFHPDTIAIIAPGIWLPPETYEAQPGDSYFRLDLPLKTVDQGVAYMVRRASRELQVTEGGFGREHRKMVKAFLSHQDLSPEYKKIFKNIQRYLDRSRTACLLEARKGDNLVAFTIVDFGSADYAFYLFNFRSAQINVPGASDLLFHEMAGLAFGKGKKALNLGLGINHGIRRFKEKWGGIPFLPYASAFLRRRTLEMGSLLKKL